MTLRPVGQRQQRTIARSAEVQGVGFVTGADIRLRFLPAPGSTGVVFRRVDLRPKVSIPASVDNVTNTNRRTTLSVPGTDVSLVEHVLSALAGLHIDNCIVELDAPEPPGLDGSANGYVTALLEAGIQMQADLRSRWTVREPVVLRSQRMSVAIYPAERDETRLSYFLDYGPFSSLGRQNFTQTITPSTYAKYVANSRTFILEEEVKVLRQQGLGSRTTAADLLVFGPHGPIDNPLRYANEPARHKLLDMVGDFALMGIDLCGHIVAYRSGHQLNVELARTLHAQLPTTKDIRRVA